MSVLLPEGPNDTDSDSEDEDDDEEDLFMTMLAAAFLLDSQQMRSAKWQHSRLLWDQHVAQLLHEHLFEQTYRMSHNAFVTLQKTLGERIVFNAGNALGVMPIPPEIVMATGLRWLSGCPSLDLHIAMGISISSVYCCRDTFFAAVN